MPANDRLVRATLDRAVIQKASSQREHRWRSLNHERPSRVLSRVRRACQAGGWQGRGPEVEAHLVLEVGWLRHKELGRGEKKEGQVLRGLQSLIWLLNFIPGKKPLM